MTSATNNVNNNVFMIHYLPYFLFTIFISTLQMHFTT